ncbi:MAG: polysaccharide biosynthesis tyrosine autokinase [Solirubrobacteraceae bacterium]
MELKDLAALAWKRRWIILAVFALSVTVSAALAFSMPKRYESTAVIALTPDVEEGQGFVASDNLSALLGTYAETAKSRLTLRRAEALLGRPLPGDVDTSTQGGTGILRISARAGSPEDAAAAASATSRAFLDSIAGNNLLVSTLVDPASPSTTPVQPRPPLIIMVAAFLGLFAGLMLAFGIEKFRRRIETADDLAEFSSAPVVGRLPRHRTLARGAPHVVWEDENAVGLQESYRALRTNIEFLLQDAKGVLEITSPDPGQGKSTIVANLAVAFGQIGVETIVVDADLRRPRQHEIFGLDNSSGLSTILAFGEEPEPKPSGFPGVWVVTSGPVPPDPTEMLHVRFASTLKTIRSQRALILIDTPPVLPVSDARLIAPHTDGVVLLLTAGSQKPAHLQDALQKLEMVDARVLALILNRTGQESADASGGYYYSPNAGDRAPNWVETG